MKLSQDVLIASRYQPVDRLGAGAMGEVWRARDTRFDTRTVAIKFLCEDETLKEDLLNRGRLLSEVEQHAARGTLSFEAALASIVAALGTSNAEGVRARLSTVVGNTAIQPAEVVAVFDALVNDPAVNDNARLRAKMRRLFRDEANVVANLRHDNVVSIFDYGDHEGRPYLVMDYIEGRTLDRVIQERQPLKISRRIRLIEDLCAGLGHAHRHKLVHRDIKPANLIIDGSTGSLKVLDFGVVRRLGSASTVVVPIGTFCYMSPEQTRGLATLDHRSDIFAVGLVLYELITGKMAYPPSKSLGDLVLRIQRDPPPADPAIPEALQRIINKALLKRPEDRYADLTIMGSELSRVRMRLAPQEPESLLDDRTVIKARTPPSEPVKRAEPVKVVPTPVAASDVTIELPRVVLRPPMASPPAPSKENIPLPAAVRPAPAAPEPATPSAVAPTPPSGGAKLISRVRPGLVVVGVLLVLVVILIAMFNSCG